MEKNKFGVKLKSTGTMTSSSSVTTSASRRRPLHPAKFSDIKAKFDDGSSSSTQATGAKKTVASPSSALKNSPKLNANGSTDASDNLDDLQPATAVSKVFDKDTKAFKASLVSSNVQRRGSGETTVPVDKKFASSLLSDRLALIRTRPGSGKRDEQTSIVSSSSTTTEPSGGLKTTTTTTSKTSYSSSSTNYNSKPQGFSSSWQTTTTTTKNWSSKQSEHEHDDLVPELNLNALQQFDALVKDVENKDKTKTSSVKDVENKDKTKTSSVKDVENKDKTKTSTVLPKLKSSEELTSGFKLTKTIANTNSATGVRTTVTTNISVPSKDKRAIVNNVNKPKLDQLTQPSKLGIKGKVHETKPSDSSLPTNTSPKLGTKNKVQETKSSDSSSTTHRSPKLGTKNKVQETKSSDSPPTMHRSPKLGTKSKVQETKSSYSLSSTPPKHVYGAKTKLHDSKSADCVENKPAWMNKSKEMVNKFQTKLKRNDSTSSDTSVSSGVSVGQSPRAGSVDTTSRASPVSSVSSSRNQVTSTKSATNGKPTKPFTTSYTAAGKIKTTSTTFSKTVTSSGANTARTEVKSNKTSVNDIRRSSNASNASDSGSDSKISAYLKRVNSVDAEKPSKTILDKRDSFETTPPPQGPKRSETLQKLKEAGELAGVKSVAERLDFTHSLQKGQGQQTGQKVRGESVDEEYDDVGVEKKEDDWPSDISCESISDGDNDVDEDDVADDGDSEGLYECIGPGGKIIILNTCTPE